MIDRYSSPAMRAIWSEENKFASWLTVELAAAAAQAKLGIIPKAAYAQLKRRAKVNARRAAEIERATNHDIIGFVSATAEAAGPAGRYLHYGLTSSDVVDTAQALRVREASDLIAVQLARLEKILARQARKYKFTVMIGRSHGVHAEPITFGLKLAVFVAEIRRQRERFARGRASVEVGMLSGAVGTYANIDPRVEVEVCRALGLAPEWPSTQVIGRDRYAEYVSCLAQIAGTVERLAVEIRHLHRTEVAEAEERFARGQKGSSAMPHKRNPIVCERVAGLARLLRGYALAALEDVALWHERDISHSSVERIILPDATSLLEYQVTKMADVMEELQVNPEAMTRNLGLTRGLIFSQQVLLALIRSGLSRDDAYACVQTLTLRAGREGINFQDAVLADKSIRARLTPAELKACFALETHTRYVNLIFRRLHLG